MKKIISIILTAALFIGLLVGCGSTENEEISSSAPETEVQEEADAHEGEARSYLTGEWVDEEIAAQRPVAVMIGNTTTALPSYGLSQAEIIYEAPVEGGLTRLLAFFGDYENVDTIESIRSCRLYYIDWAIEFDAIYAHCGQSYLAKDMLESGVVDNLNAMLGKYNDIFLRDSSRSSPHNLYSTGALLADAIEIAGYDPTYDDSYTGHYNFNEDDENEIVLSGGEDAVVVQPGYLVDKPWFVYNETDGLYYRYEYGEAHVDGNDGSQIACKNIIIQICDSSVADSEHNYLNVDTMSGGEGYYITNGKAVAVTWSKDSQSAATRYFTSDGTEITLNQGKTFVCIVQNTYADRITFYASEEEFTE